MTTRDNEIEALCHLIECCADVSKMAVLILSQGTQACIPAAADGITHRVRMEGSMGRLIAAMELCTEQPRFLNFERVKQCSISRMAELEGELHYAKRSKI